MAPFKTFQTFDGLIHHKDHGCQCLSLKRSHRLAELGIQASTGSLGDGDNKALDETINGLHKNKFAKSRKF